jgi:hypothetical protein
LDDKGISKFVKTLPSALCLSVDDNLEPKLAWLKKQDSSHVMRASEMACTALFEHRR